MSSEKERQREQRLKLLEDHIGQALADSAASGELQRAASWGKPMTFGDGYDQTPAELRMPMKILKDAGIVPPEVELMREIEALAAQLADAPDDEATRAQRRRLAELRQQLALRLEHLRTSGTL